MRIQSFLLASSLLFAPLAACGSKSSAKPTTAAHHDQAAATMAAMCPVEVPGTSVAAEDTATGGALVFVTTGDVAEVRKRVAAMAAMHNDHQAEMAANGGTMAGMDHGDMGAMKGMDHAHMGHGQMGAMGGTGGTGGAGGMDHAGMMAMMNSQVAVEDVDGGARLAFTAQPADVAPLQAGLREHAQQLAGGTCAMHHGGEAHAPAPHAD